MRGDGTATAGRRILLVGPDSAIQQSLATSIVNHADVCIECAESAAQALALLLSKAFDAMLVDTALSDVSGGEACWRVRQRSIHIPIIVLGPERESDELEAFECGANDYVVQPPAVPVLLARLRAHMRQHDQRDDGEFAVGGYVFRPSTRILTRAGHPGNLRLTRMEAAVLKYLHQAQGIAVPRQALLSNVWSYREGAAIHSVEIYIHRLRRKLERDPAKPEILLTEAGGYRLIISPPSSTEPKRE